MAVQLKNQFDLKQATLILVNSFGFPVARQITVQRAELDPDKRLILQYVEKGKRKPHATRFAADTQLAVYPGWHNVAGAINGDEDGEWTQFGEGAFERMAGSVPAVAVFVQG